MPSSNKPRLHVALYARGGQPTMPGREDAYHWALIVGPKVEGNTGQGVRYHAKQKATEGGFQWSYDEQKIPLTATNAILVRVTVAKVHSAERVRDLLRSVPVKEEPGWNCVAWVKEALEKLGADDEALGTRVVEWTKVRDASISYCDQKKAAHRFDGKAPVPFDTKWPATFDLMEEREVIP